MVQNSTHFISGRCSLESKKLVCTQISDKYRMIRSLSLHMRCVFETKSLISSSTWGQFWAVGILSDLGGSNEGRELGLATRLGAGEILMSTGDSRILNGPNHPRSNPTTSKW